MDDSDSEAGNPHGKDFRRRRAESQGLITRNGDWFDLVQARKQDFQPDRKQGHTGTGLLGPTINAGVPDVERDKQEKSCHLV